MERGGELHLSFNQSTPTFLFSFLSTPRKEKKCGIDDWLMAGRQPHRNCSIKLTPFITFIPLIWLRQRHSAARQQIIPFFVSSFRRRFIPAQLTLHQLPPSVDCRLPLLASIPLTFFCFLLHSFVSLVDFLSSFASFRGAPWPATAHNRASSSTRRQINQFHFMNCAALFSSSINCGGSGPAIDLIEEKELSWTAAPLQASWISFILLTGRAAQALQPFSFFFILPIRKKRMKRKMKGWLSSRCCLLHSFQFHQ